MSALADIFAAVRLQLDGTGFEAQATALADKQGKNVGARMSQNLSASFKKAAGGAIGAVTGYASATAINGALKLNELAGEYQVQTGANAEEAKAFQGTLNGLFKTSHQGYDEIAQTLIGLKTHFGLTGEAAAGLAANYLDFSEIAGGTGADAVERFNSLIKTGIIGIEDTKTTMDDLIVAHQKFGVPINDTIDGMVKLAPAMNAVGMSAKEGAALVGLFTKAGVSGDRMAQAFNTSLTKIKSPADFPKLLKSITDAKTNFEASNIAADYFGTRVGPGLSNLLRSGGDALDAYNASLGDTAGALDKAAYANDNTFGGRALLMLHQFQGTLTEVATSMGTTSDAILMTAALLGPGLTKGLFAGIGGLAGWLAPQLAAQITAAGLNPIVAAASMSAGQIALRAFVMGATVGAGLLIAQKLGEGFQNAAGMPGASREEIAMAQIAAARARDAASNAATKAGTAFVDGYTSVLAQGAPKIEAATTGPVASAGAAAATALDSKRGAIRAAAAGVAGAIWDPISTAATNTKTSVLDTLQMIVDGYSTTWGELGQIASTYTSVVGGPVKRQLALDANNHEQAAQRKIIASRDSTAHEVADAKKRLAALQVEGIGIRIEMAGRGELNKTQYASLIADLTKQSKTGSAEVKAAAKLALAELAKLKAASDNIHIHWTGTANPGARAEGGPVLAGQPYVVGETRPELFIPETNGYILPSVPDGFGGGRVSPALAPAAGMTFVYAPTYSTASPGEAQRFAREVGPSITRWQQDRRLIGAG